MKVWGIYKGHSEPALLEMWASLDNAKLAAEHKVKILFRQAKFNWQPEEKVYDKPCLRLYIKIIGDEWTWTDIVIVNMEVKE